ncbi:MAG TPA: asparagine synthase C-terminal domain-containing protein [Bacteroidales bacterium]|nr:asparagine synthase C-terminal domain-containing protein [Bacteroidales bacterium]
MEHVYLIYNNHYHWHQRNDLIFKGFFFDIDSRHFHEDSALDFLQTITSRKELKQNLEKIDGPFTIIRKTPEGILIGNGVMSMFPVFYTLEDGQWLVSDSSENLLGLKKNKQCNTPAFDEFLGAGFVLGRETLLKDIFKIRAGEILLLKPDGTLESEFYYYWLPKGFMEDDLSDLKVQFVYKLKNVIKRLITSLNNRTAVVPLSGGYDSRLILCLLKNAGYSKVICFTYGRPNAESELSRRVAEKLGYTWIFVDYRKIDPFGYLNDPGFLDYVRYAGNNYSMPYLQEYFAVKYLKENNLVPDNSVFLPGHGGDFLAGGHLKKADISHSQFEKLPKHVLKNYYPFLPLNKCARDQIKKRLKDWFAGYNPPESVTHHKYSVYVEDWDVKEKRSKFIFQSVHTFIYFGYAFRLPLWHKDLRNLFRQVPFELRKHKLLYDELLEEEYFRPLGIYFGKEELKELKENRLIKLFAKIIKPLAPSWVISFKLKKADWVCYDRFTTQMDRQMKKEGLSPLKIIYSYNARICNWYLSQVRKLTSGL